MQEYCYYVGGEFKEGREKIEVVNPSCEEGFAKFFETEKEDLGLALETARNAQKEWKRFSYLERAKVLRQIQEVILENLKDLAELETKEIGKTLKESLFVDIPLAGECFSYYASFLESLEEECLLSKTGIDLIKYEPFGVVAVFLPYNVPLMIFGFSTAAALAAGNTLIIKPSEYGSLSVLELMKYIDGLDIPKGLINVVTGRGDTVGRFLAQTDVDLISFTGSQDTLKKIISTLDNPKKIICELGGCNLAIIFSDTDKEACLQNILGSSFMKQGQMCIGTSLVLIEENIYKDFLGDLIKKAERIKLGDPFLPDTGMGPLPTKKHLVDLDKRVKDLERKGAEILCGGSPLNKKGYFYPPTIIELKNLLYEEFFAPVILVKAFKNRQEIEMAIQNNPTGLVLSIWTKDLDKAYQLADLANCGTVWVNTFAQMDAKTPFGGTNKSGWGRQLGKFGFFEYIQPKHVGIGFYKSPVEGWFGV